MKDWFKRTFTISMGTGKRLQLIFYNDNSFQFRELPIVDASLIIRKGKDIMLGWPSFNKLLKEFPGLGNIKKTKLLLSCENDIVWDEFNQLEDAEKPEKDKGLINKWVQKRAETVRYRHQAKPGKETTMDRVVLFLGVALMVQVLFWALSAARATYS